MEESNNKWCVLPETKKIYVPIQKNLIKEHKGSNGLKYHLINMYLVKNITILGTVNFTMENLVLGCGYKSPGGNVKFYMEFLNIIKNEYIDTGLATTDFDFESNSLKLKKIYTITFKDKNTLFKHDDSSYVQLYIDEFEKIIAIKDSSVQKSILLGVYIAIKQYIYKFYGNMNRIALAYPSIDSLKTQLGLSKQTVNNAIDLLEKEKIIYVKRNIYIINEDNIPRRIRNVYALKESDLEDRYVASELSIYFENCKIIFKKQKSEVSNEDIDDDIMDYIESLEDEINDIDESID